MLRTRTASAVPPPAGRHSRISALVLSAGVVLAIGAAPATVRMAAASSAPVPTAPASSAPAMGSIGMRLLDVPAATADDPRARLYVVDHLPPGKVISRRIEISNTTADTADVALYAAAATIVRGTFVGAAGRTVDELSSWTSVRPGTLDIPAGGTVTATVRIAVPADAAPGERYGVAWAEVRSDPATGGVSQVSRVGLRLYVSVGPGNAPAAQFTIDTLTAGRSADGRPTVSASVHNTGGRALDMTGSLRMLAGPGGLSAGPYPAVLGTTLAVGATEQVRILLDQTLPDGPWDARITLRSGLLTHAARASLVFPDVGVAEAVAVESGGRPGWLYPAVAGLVLLLLVVVLLLRRRRRAAEAAAPSR
jgi:MYXO-CTERM domain-containing protein